MLSNSDGRKGLSQTLKKVRSVGFSWKLRGKERVERQRRGWDRKMFHRGPVVERRGVRGSRNVVGMVPMGPKNVVSANGTSFLFKRKKTSCPSPRMG